jgi:hypothetical protein
MTLVMTLVPMWRRVHAVMSQVARPAISVWCVAPSKPILGRSPAAAGVRQVRAKEIHTRGQAADE